MDEHDPATPMPLVRGTLLLAFAVLAVLALGWFVRPVADSDFWWHLAAGRHIAATGSVPDADPTGMYVVRADNAYWALTVLKGQWLGQLAIYGAWSLAQLDGVIVLRAALLAACLALAAWRLARAGAAAASALVLLPLAALVLQAHGGERPQLFSFALFGAALLLAEQRGVWRWALPPLLALWAQLHPGVILGALMVSVWLLIDAWSSAPQARPTALRETIGLIVLGWLATLLGPSLWHSHEYLLRLEADPLKGRVIEYQSPFTLWGSADPMALAALGLLALLSLAALPWLWRSRRRAEAAVLLIALALAAGAWRYGPFLVLAAVPAVGRAASSTWPAVRRAALPTALAALAIGSLALAYGAGQRTLFRWGLAESRQPVALAARLAERGAAGRMFNFLSWGGYLQWTLGPRVVPYLDGRLLEPARVQTYSHILWATAEGRAAFDSGRFDFVLLPRVNPVNPAQGRYPLIDRLREHPDWALLDADAGGALFVRR